MLVEIPFLRPPISMTLDKKLSSPRPLSPICKMGAVSVPGSQGVGRIKRSLLSIVPSTVTGIQQGLRKCQAILK